MHVSLLCACLCAKSVTVSETVRKMLGNLSVYVTCSLLLLLLLSSLLIIFQMSFLVGKHTAVLAVKLKNCKMLPSCVFIQYCSVTVYPSHAKVTFRLNGRHIQLFYYSFLRIPQCANT